MLTLQRVLVANRGEIACRIIRSAHALGLEAVAVHSDADRGAAHVRQADHAVRLGPAPVTDSYLRIDRILEAAHATGADSVHPGYGLLSERADFAEAVEQAGLIFVGPTPEQLRELGDKHLARRRAAALGVPLLAGTDLLLGLDEAAAAAAEAIGYPVMLKASTGGGGVGIRACNNAEELAAAWDQVRRLAHAGSGAGVILERYLSRARHVEVQVFGDGHGDVVVLGERDCSIQRRHQKLIEEAPAPRLSDATRSRLADDACRLVASVDYRSAGTVELLVDADTGEHFFLEVNPRLQVEHGVTELVTGIDLVAWMLRLAGGDTDIGSFCDRDVGLEHHIPVTEPVGHAVEARVYAENPVRDFQPNAGVLTRVELPTGDGIRCDSWVSTGTEVTPFYDPLLLKVMAQGITRDQALDRLGDALAQLRLDGVETNVEHLRAVLAAPPVRAGQYTTRLLSELDFRPDAVEVVGDGAAQVSGQTLVVAWPGRTGLWSVGVPPSGPMDDWSFRLGNRLLGNPDDAAGLECALAGPILRFHRAATVCLTGADVEATIEAEDGDADAAGCALPRGRAVEVPAGAVLRIGRLRGPGARAYVLVRGGIDVPEVLGSRTTFSLGGFGGYAGRTLLPGDLLRIGIEPDDPVARGEVPAALVPELARRWEIAVLDGPHGAPDYLTPDDVELFYATDWEVHYNSSRTGVRLVGPRLTWARADGGEAGLHPSNLHDNAYAVGTVDFTGDMPVILGPDGPSLGGFVCPATVIDAELWKLGQLQAGDRVRFIPVTAAAAAEAKAAQQEALAALSARPSGARSPSFCDRNVVLEHHIPVTERDRSRDVADAVLGRVDGSPPLTFRRSGDRHLLVEIGPPILDLDLRARAHQLAGWLVDERVRGVRDLTPGIRSLQIQVDGDDLTVEQAMDLVRCADAELPPTDDVVVPSRLVHLPLSWDDPSVRRAVDIYMRSVRPDAPWCPSNLEFIRRINGLDSVDDVREIVFAADYVVYGLGDVYLGAPVATPLDPRHRLVTTKYNPARTWTPQNAVGIGGAYLCVYGMEGPGGYQLVGRTTPVWRPWLHDTGEPPWLLRAFDRIRFHPVDADTLVELRADFAAGIWEPSIEDGKLSLADHHAHLAANAAETAAVLAQRQAAFAAERAAWEESGELAAASAAADGELAAATLDPWDAPADAVVVTAPLAARVWTVAVAEGDEVDADEPLLVLEAMKTETVIRSPEAGKVTRLGCGPGDLVTPGTPLVAITP